ncbi:MAG TPA: hypothetical protein VLU54_13705 [Casimicrobiaceae bacterium]|nr:hypothetical protein [Casimicrobiaceae bacterium]
MIEAGSLEYAHARLSARFGNRPDEAAWRRIETIRDIGAMLDAARASPLAAWLARIGRDADVHAVERAMRAHLRERVAAIAAWMPPQWRASVEWCGVVSDLPLLQHLARGGAAPAWLDDTDPLRREAIEALLATGNVDPGRLGSSWRDEWERRLPKGKGGSALLVEFVRLIDGHVDAWNDPRLVDGWAQRRRLHAGLTRLFRRATLDPAVAFIFLGLSALDFERLRGEILRRVAFPGLPLVA